MPSKRTLANVIVGLPRSAATRELGERALAEVGLSGHLRAWPHTLSGGEAQRVALARALVREPELLLLDEPFAALDALTRLRMQDLVAELCRVHRPAVLLVTHDVDEAIRLADRVAVLRDGRLITDKRVTARRPRDAADPEFTALRRRLLADLGVRGSATRGHGRGRTSGQDSRRRGCCMTARFHLTGRRRRRRRPSCQVSSPTCAPRPGSAEPLSAARAAQLSGP